MSPRSAMCSFNCTAQEALRTSLVKAPLAPKYCIQFIVETRSVAGGASMLGMCLWIAIGAACGGAFVGGLLVLWSVRAP